MRLTESAVGDLREVAAAFDLGDLVGEPRQVARGEQGRVWRVVTSAGCWAVKEIVAVNAAERAVDAVAFERRAATLVHIPRTRLLPDESPLLANLGPPDRASAGYRVMEWIDVDPEQRPSATDLGAAAAAIHRVDCPASRPVEPWFASGPDLQAWQRLLADARATNEAWADAVGRRLPELDVLREAVAGSEPVMVRTSHRDLNTGNLVRDRSGAVVVLDWDLCGPIDLRREIALVVARQGLETAEAAVATYESYLNAGGPARIDGLDAFAGVSIACDNLTHHYAQRLMSSDRDDARAAGDRLAWILDAVDTATPAWLERLAALLVPLHG